MVRGMAFVSSARLWMTVVVRQSAAVRTANSFIGPAGCTRPGGDSMLKSGQTGPCRAVLKSGNLARDEAADQVKAAAHLLFEGWTSAIARPALAACPTPILSLYGSAHDAQHGRGHRVAHPAAVFCGAHVQAVMQAVFNAPILAGQFEQASGTGLLGTQTGDHPNGLHFLLATLEFADAIDSCQLQHMREAHLRRGDGQYLDAPPFNSAMTPLDLQKFRGKNLPGGSVWLGREGGFGCPWRRAQNAPHLPVRWCGRFAPACVGRPSAQWCRRVPSDPARFGRRGSCCSCWPRSRRPACVRSGR